MKNQLLIATALTALSFSALAADLPARTFAPASPAPIFSWTGFYVGGTIGALTADFKSTDSYQSYSNSTYYYGSKGTPTSVTVGATIGYNQQFGSMVAGLEADYNFAKGTTNNVYDGYARDGKSTFGSFGTVRGRLGYAMDRTLFFVTAGLAVADIKGKSGYSCTTGFSKQKFGWVAGGGVEYALTNSLTVKAEALYADFGSMSASKTYGYQGCAHQTFKSKTTAVIGRTGLNFKF